MRVHFIAIGGSVMHNLALALQQKEYIITGSDDVIYEPSKTRLGNAGLLPNELGWDPDRIHKDIDAVILGMHAKPDNPEFLQARRLGLKIYSYPEFLYEHSKNKTRVVIGGSHGKTTVTAMVLHVLQFHKKKVDYIVGAQLKGFENMVKLSDSADFIVLEGDEYLSSPVDRRPKFHLYKPNIALLTGIAWDHINVFPTFEKYLEQFSIFVDSIVKGGILVYNEEDEHLKKIVENSTNQIRKHPYKTPPYKISEGTTFLETPEGDMPVEIFGKHNLNNLAGAKWICQHMGIDEDDFYQAISSFSGASKRLEKFKETRDTIIFKDFAHSPSKVKATTSAVRDQYPEKKLIACVELHTFSSLNKSFLDQYKNSVDQADIPVVFYSPEAIKGKQMEPISPEEIKRAFGMENLRVFIDPFEFKEFLKKQDYKNVVLLLMSSGTYGGIDLEEIFSNLV